MITQIDIHQFGLFQDFEWSKTQGRDRTFGKLNIIYGRNYSGKTTFSRIVKCLEDRNLHPDYFGCKFKVTFEDSLSVTQENLSDVDGKWNIRVYNSDFVRENLGWLRNADGSIKAFTVLGAENVELEGQIAEIKKKLGSVEERTGLRGGILATGERYKEKRDELSKKKAALETKLQQKARSIKENAAVFNRPTYQINRIKEDIPHATKDAILTEEQRERLRRLIREDSLDSIANLSAFTPNFAKLEESVSKLLKQVVKPTKQIQELLENHVLQAWVKSGIEIHRNKRSVCGFCGTSLPSDLWEKIDAHFTEESERLVEELSGMIDLVVRERIAISNLVGLTREKFYESLKPQFDELLAKWKTSKNAYIAALDLLTEKLEQRKSSIFDAFEIEPITNPSDDLLGVINSINELINSNNLKSSTLEQERSEAQEKLRLSEVAAFLVEIDYQTVSNEIEKLDAEVKKIVEVRDSQLAELSELTREQEGLEASSKDESHGAELINDYIARSFGHEHLRLVADGQDKKTKFKITRDGEDARNLSEGECSLISFCYFIATLKDQMDVSTVIFIDDPISSLDSNHIFLVFSLIENKIAKPKKYKQLFISTHNLEFLKYLRRLTSPNHDEHFLIERRQQKTDRRSFVLPMPKHLKEYVTEFNYLFNEIYSLYKPANGDRKRQLENTYNTFYNFPNNLRKFLECYLFYKFPNNESLINNLEKLFDNNVPALLNRVVNEYSHLTYLERGWIPIDVHEAEECAEIVVEMLKKNDPAQFAALLQSTGN